MGYFRFFFYTDWTFYRPVHKKNYKNPLNFYSLKVKKFHSNSVKYESTMAKNKRGGGAKPLSPSLFRVNR